MRTEVESLKLLGVKDRNLLITGASSGLGEHFARLFAAHGARVVLTARRVERLESVCKAIIAAGGEALVVPMDVADEKSTIAAFDAAERALGSIDAVVANAGMNIEGSIIELESTEMDRVIDVNLRGVILTVREAARRMLRSNSNIKRQGRILIVASITAHEVSPGLSLYSATKAGVVQFGKVVAREWAKHGINVNVICPGYIETDLNQEWFSTEAGRQQILKYPRRRLMDAASLDTTALYLCGDASEFVTGSVITIDDGQSLA